MQSEKLFDLYQDYFVKGENIRLWHDLSLHEQTVWSNLVYELNNEICSRIQSYLKCLKED